jgi:hypothetical protein
MESLSEAGLLSSIKQGVFQITTNNRGFMNKKISYQQNELKIAETLARKGFPAICVLTIFL